MEIAKRLEPLKPTVRELALYSGNECAFPGCGARLMNQKRQWIGEVCHIEAAEPGGERFNEAMSNEERRAASNLVLMCHPHHVETNDVDEFPVERMREIKAEHEARFASAPPVLSADEIEHAIDAIVASSIVDRTDGVRLHLPQTLAAYHGHLNLSLEERQETISEFLRPMLERLRRLPVDTRKLWAIAGKRSRGGRFAVPLSELEYATGLSPEEINEHALILDRWRIGFSQENDDHFGERPSFWELVAYELEWDFWGELVGWTEAEDVDIDELITELRFDWLDEPPVS